jgi:16S rRNA (cytosine1402-N4)-methyltransferase
MGIEMGGAVHRPVMVSEVIEYLKPEKGKVIVDGTVGTGGHAESILGHIRPGGRLIAIDRDPEAISKARERLVEASPAVSYHCENYRDIRSVLDSEGIERVDGILLDLGVSSLQLEDADRGFSYRKDGPLDMKMGPDAVMSAAEIINNESEDEITRILYNYGEERWARRIAHFIIETRKRRPILTTHQLVEVVLNAVPAGARRGRKHPARKTFQALRIAVNHELDDLREGILQGIECLALAGRMVILTYQSLEDRIVKSTFSSLAKGSAYPPGEPLLSGPMIRVLTSRPVRPGEEETLENPRSRSAKLRAAERIRNDEGETRRGEEIQ